MDEGAFDGVIALGLLVLAIATLFIYIVPSIVAFHRQHPNRWLIVLLNLLAGSTVIGWIAALIWATRSAHLSPQGCGGESGLNLFANDEKKMRIVEPHAANPITDLERLAVLRNQGLLTDQEFQEQKARLLPRAISSTSAADSQER